MLQYNNYKKKVLIFIILRKRTDKPKITNDNKRIYVGNVICLFLE